jgi:hypothetical protein
VQAVVVLDVKERPSRWMAALSLRDVDADVVPVLSHFRTFALPFWACPSAALRVGLRAP